MPRLRRPRGDAAANVRQPKHIAAAVNEVWSMDFLAGALLFNGRALCVLSPADCHRRDCLDIDVKRVIRGEDVVQTLNRVCAERGPHKTVKTDNGSEFISKALDKWAADPQLPATPGNCDLRRVGGPSF